jgi:hypothetical protein
MGSPVLVEAPRRLTFCPQLFPNYFLSVCRECWIVNGYLASPLPFSFIDGAKTWLEQSTVSASTGKDNQEPVFPEGNTVVHKLSKITFLEGLCKEQCLVATVSTELCLAPHSLSSV